MYVYRFTVFNLGQKCRKKHASLKKKNKKFYDKDE